MKRTALGMLIFAVLISTMAFGQQPTYKISGKVINGSNGEPVAKASVSFQYGGDGPVIMLYIQPAITGADGSYSIELPQSTYYLIVKHPDFEPYLQKEIKVTSDSTLDFKLMPAVPPVKNENYVKGTVFEKESGQPLGKVSVSLLGADGRKIFIGTTSDHLGNFALTNIPEGDYYVSASTRGYIQYRDTAKLAVNGETKLEGLKISLQKDSSYINDLVKSLKFYVYKIDASGNKTDQPDAKILLMGSEGNTYEGITDANGVFILNEALAGMYKVMVTAEGNTEYTSVAIKTDGQTFEIAIKEPIPVAQGTIKGRVFSNADSSGIEGASVYVIPAGSSKPADPVFTILPYFGATTDANGEYSFPVTVGDYYVICAYVDKFGYSGVTEYYDNAKSALDAKVITVVKDTVVSGINFGLDKAVTDLAQVTISGKMVNASGNPVKEAKLVLYDRKSEKQIGTHAKTGPDGKYYAAVTLPKGHNELQIGAYAPNCQVQFYNGKSSLDEADVVSLDITGDKAMLENIDFTLAGYERTGNYSISGRVVDEDVKPVMGVYVELFGSFNRSIKAITDSTGSYKISDLPAGKYIVGFFAKGYRPVFYKDALTWEKATPVELSSDVNAIDAVIKKTEMHAFNGAFPGKIAGRIAGKDNKPVSGVRVILTTLDGKAIAADMSNALGEYTLSGVIGGSYKLVTSKVNYQSIESDLNVDLGKTNESIYNINLSTTTAAEDHNKIVAPAKYVLENNFPNPFNPSTRIRFAIPEAAHIKLEVYSVIGQKMATLVDENMSAGYHEVNFNASGLASGIYLYKMSAGSFTEVKSMFLMK